MVVAVLPPSDSVAVVLTVREKSAPLSGGGVTLSVESRSNWSPLRVTTPSTGVRVTAPSSVPMERVAPDGMSAISTDEISSEPSVSASDGEMSREIAVSSAPDAAETLRLGASATAKTLTDKVSVTVTVD